VDLLKGEHHAPDYLKRNPNGKVPTLVDGDFALWESNAIIQYLAAKHAGHGLWPADPRGQADVSRWQCWELAHWGPACSTLVFERFVKQFFGQGDPNPSEVARGEEELHRCAEVLDGHLRRRQWLVGDELTLADVSVGAWLAYSEHYPVGQYPEIVRWYQRLAALPSWQKALPAGPPSVSEATVAGNAPAATAGANA